MSIQLGSTLSGLNCIQRRASSST